MWGKMQAWAEKGKERAKDMADKAKAMADRMQNGYECKTKIVCNETVHAEKIQEAIVASLAELGDVNVTDDQMEEQLAALHAAISDQGAGWWNVTEGISARVDESTGLSAIRMSIIMKDITPETAYECLFGIEARANWDAAVQEIVVLKQLGEDSDVRYEKFQWPNPLWNRDNVARLRLMRSTTESGATTLTILCETIKDPRVPACQDRVRCWGRTVCVMTALEDGSCSVERLTMANPNGNIPGALVNATGPRMAAGWMEKFRTACAERQAKA